MLRSCMLAQRCRAGWLRATRAEALRVAACPWQQQQRCLAQVSVSRNVRRLWDAACLARDARSRGSLRGLIVSPKQTGWHGAVRCASGTPGQSNEAEAKAEKKKKQSLTAWLWDQVLHIWHGFRLLGVNVGITLKLKRQISNGQKLTRREKQLLQTTTQDMLRLVPFSVFIIVPGGELLLPVALAMFPNLMPSTFDTSESRRKREIMSNLTTGIARRRLFEHMAINVLSQSNFEPPQSTLDVFRACTKGGRIDGEILKTFAPHFQDSGPLAWKKLPFYVLSDLSVLTNCISRARLRFETTFFPRQLVEVRLRYLLDCLMEKRIKDDGDLHEKDIQSMTAKELEQECSRRKMRWVGPPEALRTQLLQWRELSLDPDIPSHLLLFLYPCATDSDVMLECLSKDEQDHILGLKKFQDTPFYTCLRDVTNAVSAKSQANIEKGIMEDDLDDVKQKIQQAQEEAEAAAHEFDELKEALSGTSDEKLLETFDQLIATSPSVTYDAEGNAGIGVEALLYILRRCGAPLTYSTRVACLQIFDMDGDNVITRDEFKAFLSRVRMS